MSYFASSDDDDPIYAAPPSRGRKQRSSSKKSRSSRRVFSDKGHGDDDPDWCEPSSEDERRLSRVQAKQQRDGQRLSEARLKATSEVDKPSRSFWKKKKRGKTRQEQIQEDLYATDYHEVNDGIVGCADDLCINKSDYLEVEDDLYAGDYSKSRSGMFSPNNGKTNGTSTDTDQEVYIVYQRYGYLSIFFGVIQIGALAVMMWQCGIAPMHINPMFGPFPDALSEWGGKNAVLIIEDGEWWRLMTPILLHAGVIHLFCNVAVQLELGVFFEREWGSLTWLIIYLGSALGSSVLSVITMPDAVSVGSSGAVMGLFGGKLAEIICRACERTDTTQGKVAHEVRKEQCVGVTCSVVVVMAFSFIPYGTFKWLLYHCAGIAATFFFYVLSLNSHTT